MKRIAGMLLLLLPVLALSACATPPPEEAPEQATAEPPHEPRGTGLRAAEDTWDYSSDGMEIIMEWVRPGDADYGQYLDFLRDYESPGLPLAEEDWPPSFESYFDRMLDCALSPNGRFLVLTAYWHESKPSEFAAEVHGYDLAQDQSGRQIMGQPLWIELEPMRLNRCAFYSDRELLVYGNDTVEQELDFLLYLFEAEEPLVPFEPAEPIEPEEPETSAEEPIVDDLMQQMIEGHKKYEQLHQFDMGWLVGDGYHLYLEDEAGAWTLLVEGYESYGESMKVARFYEAIDETRFVYLIGGWEWTWGCGIFDLATMEDHYLTSNETGLGRCPLLLTGNTLYTIGDVLYGSYTGDFNLGRTDLTTYETIPLLTNLTDDFLTDLVDYAISPDGRLFAIATSQKIVGENEPDKAVYCFEVESGALLLEHHLNAQEKTVEAYYLSVSQEDGVSYAADDGTTLTFTW